MAFTPVQPHRVEVIEALGTGKRWVERWALSWDPHNEMIEVAEPDPPERAVLTPNLPRVSVLLGNYRGFIKPAGPGE
jgi:hypothetical protein